MSANNLNMIRKGVLWYQLLSLEKLCWRFDWMLQSYSLLPWWWLRQHSFKMSGKFFPISKLVSESSLLHLCSSQHDLGILTNPLMIYLPKKCRSFLQKFSIANNVEAPLLPGCSYHQTVSLPKKPNLLLAVATHQAQNDDIRFMALCHTKNMIAVV